MKRLWTCFWVACILALPVLPTHAQQVAAGPEIVLLADTQAPFRVEKVLYGDHRNEVATAKIFADIIQRKPAALLLLGDVVAAGYQESRWLKIDNWLDSLRKQDVQVTGLMGNHDLWISASKGEEAFRKRFPDMVSTGFVKLVDSIAFVMLNSNFRQLSAQQMVYQDSFYRRTLVELDRDVAVKLVIVCCHHAPYSNSQVVGSNKQVQERFVQPFMLSVKAKLFVTGHAHDFEHFRIGGKDFLTIGGGGGVHHPLNKGAGRIRSASDFYDPEFHYLLLQRNGASLDLVSRRLLPGLTGFENAYRFTVQ